MPLLQHNASNLMAPVELAPLKHMAERAKEFTGPITNYLVSEKIYEQFSRHAEVFSMDENLFDADFIQK